MLFRSAFVWLPPPPGAAMALSAAPGGAGVLALSRMVAVPRNERRMQHISKALYRQASRMIDRGRWPVLVTWSDASLGHTGHVYKCAGWQEDEKRKAVFFEDEHGHRASRYSNGKIVRAGKGASTVLTRWIDRACPEGAELRHLLSNGWVRVPTGKVWASGKPA